MEVVDLQHQSYSIYMCMYMYVYVCMYIIMYVTPKSLNGTLAVDSPFQTLTVDFSSNLTSSTTAYSRNVFPVEKIKDFLV